MSNNTDKLPSITPVEGGNSEQMVEAVEQLREIIEVRENRRNRDSGNRFVTVAELIAAGILPSTYK